jgi:CheY-like chemotaxis protein/HPt (histidine-containing phosphotransfer) domain-containing protein
VLKAGVSGSVLVVEDNYVNQQVALEILKTLGCSVQLASNGQEAVRMMDAADYDLVFMDCEMPGMDGFATTAAVRRTEGDKKHTPIVAMTAHAMKGDRERCLDAGMDDYISKPIDPGSVLEVLRRWLVEVSVKPMEEIEPAPANPETVLDFDLPHALWVCGGKREMLKRLLNVFLDSAPGRLNDLRTALTSSDKEEVRRIAHSVKGSASSVGAMVIAKIAFEMELCAQHGGMDAAFVLCEDLDAAIERLHEIEATFFVDV